MKILIVKLGSIGDVIHAMPAVTRLRRALPEARIDWVVERYARPVLSHAQSVDRIIEIDTLRWRRSVFDRANWRKMRQTVRDLRGMHYDVVFDLQGLWKSAVVAFLADAREVVGGDRHSLREPHSSIFYSRRIDRKLQRENVIYEHLKIVEAYLQTRNSSGGAIPSNARELVPLEFDRLFGEAERDWVDEELKRRQWKHFVIVNPGAQWKSKRWPTENYARLSRRLMEELGRPVVITVGPSEEKLGRQILADLPNQPAVVLAPGLSQFAALAERASLFVGPDTGPLHIAAACRTPIVGIYASTDPVRNGPFHPADLVVQQNQCGRYCYRRDCGKRLCITGIPVEAVFKAVQSRLEQATPIPSG
ncbi:MAG: lipopolysaccharide heptosyltransferase I [Terriglobia bacterium]